MVSKHPAIIQGGMGAGVSSWRLARVVSQLGQLGVVSGTALDLIVARRLQDGDPGGHMRRGFDRFPFHKMAERIWERYYIPGGKTENQSYKSLPKHSKDNPRELIELCIEIGIVFLSTKWRSVFGKGITSPAARQKTSPTRACRSIPRIILAS